MGLPLTDTELPETGKSWQSIERLPAIGNDRNKRRPSSQFSLVPIDDLRPTQATVGMRAVVHKRRKFETRAARKRKQAEKLLSCRPIPAVLGPGNELFIVDHHHFGLALWHADVDSAYVRIIEDYSDLTPTIFWARMEAEGRLHPYDEYGQRISPEELPMCLYAMRHDPYRDLAWTVKKAGGFEKLNIPFVEFYWADFFRARISMALLHRNHRTAVERALKLAKSNAGAALPGYIGVAA